jgi:hypothetical protein
MHLFNQILTGKLDKKLNNTPFPFGRCKNIIYSSSAASFKTCIASTTYFLTKFLSALQLILTKDHLSDASVQPDFSGKTRQGIKKYLLPLWKV